MQHFLTFQIQEYTHLPVKISAPIYTYQEICQHGMSRKLPNIALLKKKKKKKKVKSINQ